MGRLYDYDYAIRIPLTMIQLTERDGRAYPLAFDWTDEDGAVSRLKIEKVYSFTPCAEQKSGVVGDRYECLIGGQREYLYYSLVSPRKWFKLKPVTEDEYKAYYRLPGEPAAGEPKLRRPRSVKIAEDPADYGADVNLAADMAPGMGLGAGAGMGAGPGAGAGAGMNMDLDIGPGADADAGVNMNLGMGPGLGAGAVAGMGAGADVNMNLGADARSRPRSATGTDELAFRRNMRNKLKSRTN